MKAFLKFNRSDTASIMCLYHWLELFRDYDITVVCDLYNVDTQPRPAYLNETVVGKSFDVINSDYSTGNIMPFKARKRKMASANFTCFNLTTNEHYYWLIDADDTMFLIRDYNLIKEKLKQVEYIASKDRLDGFSLDFYRETNNDHWSFGVCLLKGNLDMSKLQSVTPEDVDAIPGLAKNLDSWFDILRRRKVFNLKSFVFDNIPFQHCINPMPQPMHGIYFWNNKMLGTTPLREDVIIL